MKAPFFIQPNQTIYLPSSKEKEVRVLGLGYNDFHFVSPHKHERTQSFYTFHYVISGQGVLHFEGKTYSIKEGQIFALPPNKPICYYPNDTDPWEYVFIEFDGTEVQEYLQSVDFSLSSPIKTSENAEYLLDSFKKCLDKSKNGAPISRFEAISLLMEFFKLSSSQPNSGLFEEEDAVVNAKKIIKMRYTNSDLTVAQIASSLHFSHSVLCRLFHKKEGQTMISYIVKCRMSYAEELLRNTDLPASKIAYMAGFKEYTYFLMLFKRKHSMTTAQYRKQFRS